jgi:4-aminobutyrate aminotransferase/(S)-3-amino-2-methylpropionate transaminase
MLSDSELLKIEEENCSFGDTVHYVSPPKIFRKCEGSFLYDSNDTPYYDLQMWYSACNFGYKNKRLENVLIEQLRTLPQLAPNLLGEAKVLLAKQINDLNKKRFNEKGRVHFNVGGSQSVEDSLKLVRNYKKKDLVFAYMGGYHGRTLAASAITSSYRYRKNYGHFGDRAQFIPYPYCFRCHYGKKFGECDYYCVKQFEKLFETEYNAIIDSKTKETEYVAFYIEAIQGTGGYIIPPRDYFKKLKNILDEYNILLVDDEIQMGFYRTGKLWAIENFGVTPDIIIFGKSLTNGLNPLAGLWAKEELINPEIFPPGSTHSTFSSNPIGTRLGLEVTKIISEENFEQMVNEKGEKFLAGLKYLKEKFKNIGDVDGLGLALRMEICENDGFTPSKRLTDAMVEEGLKGNLSYKNRKMGLVLDVGGYYKNVITIAPNFYITDDEINMSIELLEQLLNKVIANEN